MIVWTALVTASDLAKCWCCLCIGVINDFYKVLQSLQIICHGTSASATIMAIEVCLKWIMGDTKKAAL